MSVILRIVMSTITEDMRHVVTRWEKNKKQDLLFNDVEV